MQLPLADTDIAALERATLAAVPPQVLEESAGWLLAIDGGTITRAASAVPLRHAAPQVDALRESVEARYAAHGLPPRWRVPQVPAFDGLQRALQADGYRFAKPTCTLVVPIDALAIDAPRAHVLLATHADDGWAAVFLGDGFDPVDGASRTAILRRARGAVFARVVLEGRTVAVGSACSAHGWCGVHGLRTLPAWRGRGLASAIVAALVDHARQRGIARAFLQVEQENPAARLYRRMGFQDAWTYGYWTQPR